MLPAFPAERHAELRKSMQFADVQTQNLQQLDRIWAGFAGIMLYTLRLGVGFVADALIFSRWAKLEIVEGLTRGAVTLVLSFYEQLT